MGVDLVAIEEAVVCDLKHVENVGLLDGEWGVLSGVRYNWNSGAERDIGTRFGT